MKKFSYKNELKNIIDSKQLVEVNFRGDTEHAVAYIMDINDEYVTFARISNDVTLEGVIICLASDIESIQIETKFIHELSKNKAIDLIHEEASNILKDVNEFSFHGIASTFQGSETIIEITTVDNDRFSGKVVALDDSAIVLDEYYPQDTGRFARTYLNPSLILRMTVGGTWLKLIARSVVNKT